MAREAYGGTALREFGGCLVDVNVEIGFADESMCHASAAQATTDDGNANLLFSHDLVFVLWGSAPVSRSVWWIVLSCHFSLRTLSLRPVYTQIDEARLGA